MKSILTTVALIGALVDAGSILYAEEKQVALLKTPGQGIQPQALMDGRGNLHLLYFQGDPRGGDLFLVRRDAGKNAFSKPLRVNSQPGSAVAMGTIRGGHLALGKEGRVHVAWNGSMKAAPKNPIAGMPMLYARLDDQGTAFEPQRNLMTKTMILDGGGSLAADQQGNVYVAWHALGQNQPKGEGNRQLWVSVSSDDGKTFAAEKPAWNEPTGACGCCGIRGMADLKGNAWFLYRGASEKTNRGMYLVRSTDQGKTFAGAQLDNWRINLCPMSSEAFAEGPAGVVAAWDNDGQVFFTRVPPGKLVPEPPQAAPGGKAARKHPALAVNKNGEMILVWTEDTGWNRGGHLAWQVYAKSGQPTSSGRRQNAIPVWSLPTVIAEADGQFTIVH